MWIIVPILIFTLFAFRAIMPYKIPEKFKGITMQSLEAEFKKTHLIFLLVFILLLISTTIIFSFIFENIFNKQNPDSSIVFSIRIDEGFWIIISMIFGIAFSIILLNLFLNIILKENSIRFWIYYNLKYRFNALLVLNILTGLFLLTGIVFTYFGSTTNVYISDKSIKIKTLFSVSEKVYNFSDVKAIVYYENKIAPNGDKVFKPHFKVVFSDNFEWSTITDLREPKKDDNQIFEYISKMSNMEITEEDVDY